MRWVQEVDTYPLSLHFDVLSPSTPLLSQFPIMGYSVRTHDWRLTLWQRWDGENLAAHWDLLVAAELYDMKLMPDSSSRCSDTPDASRLAQTNPSRVHH